MVLAIVIQNVRNLRISRPLGICLALILSPGTLTERQFAASVKLPHSSVHQLALSTGLSALLVENHDAPVVSVEVWYHVGSKDEVPGRTGFAHLFEHLMYQGTKNLGPEEYSDYIIRYGGLDNAYTTEDMTVFWETVPGSVLPVALWLEADRMRNLQITDKVFKNEREVV